MVFKNGSYLFYFMGCDYDCFGIYLFWYFWYFCSESFKFFGGINMSIENVRKWFMIYIYFGYEKKVKIDFE